MRKEQYFHFRRHFQNPNILIPPSPEADSRGGICIFAQPIESENVILWGIAKCHENDNYVKAKARTIAKGRAVSNHIRKQKGKPEIPNVFGTTSPFMDYDKATIIAVLIANALYDNGLSSFADLDIDWENEQVSVNKNEFPF